MRSQGIILLGAQQQASRVSETIFGNSEFKVLDASSPVELESPTWSRLLGQSQKARALTLQPEEKMVLVSRGWMHVIVPFPAWAMKEAEASVVAPTGPGSNGSAAFTLNMPEDGYPFNTGSTFSRLHENRGKRGLGNDATWSAVGRMPSHSKRL